MEIKVIKDSFSRTELKKIAQDQFGDFVKAVVDIKKGIMAIGGELHADEEAVLLEQGSDQENLWGINLYYEKAGEDFIEYDSMINVRPAHDNRSRGVEDSKTRERIKKIISKLVSD